MISLIYFLLVSFSLAETNPFLGHDFGQHYSRIRIFEYETYSDVKLLKFHIHGPATIANWSISITTEGQCPPDFANIHFYLQQGSYPLVSPRNESFPLTYITKRHDLFRIVFNQTFANQLIQLNYPLIGTWFALSFVDRHTSQYKSKILSSGCNFYLSTWLDYQIEPVTLSFVLNEQLQVVLNSNKPSVYASYYTSTGNSRLNIISEWSNNCQIIVYSRINGLPNSLLYDSKTICGNKSCTINIGQYSASLWIYFQITVADISCLTNPLHGVMLLRSTKECTTNCTQSYPTRRIMFNYYYDFLYVPIYAINRSNSGSTSSITLNAKEFSFYSYEFIVDDRNIGGTLHLDLESRMMPFVPTNINASILVCLSKHRVRSYHECDDDYRIFLEKNSVSIRSIPYPEMGLWYLSFEYFCNQTDLDCQNGSLSLMFQMSSSQCTKQQCGAFGICRIMTSQQNVFSTCSCIAGYRGFACTDSTFADTSKNLSRVLFLTLSNLMFLPPIAVAIYRRLYIEGLIYSFNMFFSTFYHACDQDINKFCIFKYDGLQLSDFIGSYASFVITLITMSIIPRSIKVFLFMLGVLACIVINSRDRFDHLQFIYLISSTFLFTISTWIITSIRLHRLQPSAKRLFLVLPGFCLALAGLILFAFGETEENYWYTHSLWHVLIASSILFFLPHRDLIKKERKIEQRMESLPTNSDSPTIVIINQGTRSPIDNSSLSSSNTDSSKKSTDNLLI